MTKEDTMPTYDIIRTNIHEDGKETTLCRYQRSFETYKVQKSNQNNFLDTRAYAQAYCHSLNPKVIEINILKKAYDENSYAIK